MTDLRVTVGIVAAVGVAIGLGLVSLLRGNGDEDQPSPVLTPSKENAASISAELAACRDDLAFERSARIALAEEMEKRTDLFAKGFVNSQSGTAESKSPSTAESKSVRKASRHISIDNPDNPFGANWFSEDVLVELGMHPDEIARLRDRFDELEVEKRELNHLAAREGWSENPLYGAAILESYEKLREDVGTRTTTRSSTPPVRATGSGWSACSADRRPIMPTFAPEISSLATRESESSLKDPLPG